MIGKVLAMLLGVVIVLLSLTSIHYRFKVHNIMNRLKKTDIVIWYPQETIN
ncbi:MAG: hypothetical protein K6A61_08920 [Butyrivibrio sp.]|nr:hypothetical protein [Butyrivibrio sp.]